MELIPDEEFVSKWLSRSHFKEPKVTEMLVNQLNYFTNRRQIDKFHLWLFNCCRSVDLSFEVIYLPQGFKSIYGEKIIKSPPLQTIQTWKLFLEEDIAGSPVLLELFISFLHHLKICDDLVPKMIIPQENQCIQATREEIINLPFGEVKSQSQLALVLRLSLAWGNLILLKYFYDNEKITDELVELPWYDMGPIHDYFEADVWEAIITQSLSSEDQLFSTVFQLMIQKLSFFTKAMTTESDPEIRSICEKNIKVTVDRILDEVNVNPGLLDSFDLWKFSTFVPDEHVDQLTKLIVDCVIACEDEMTVQLSSTIEKGCERSSFVLSMMTTIVQKFVAELDEATYLYQLFDYLVNQQFLDDPPEMLDSTVVKKVKRLISKSLDGNKKVSRKLTAFRTLEILKYLPLEHLRGEAQLKCSIFLITLAFSLGLETKAAESTIQLVIPILKSDQTLWFFKACDPTNFISTLISLVVKEEAVISATLEDFIASVIDRLFADHPKHKIIKILEDVGDSMSTCENPVASRRLMTLVLKSLVRIDCSGSEIATILIFHLLELFEDYKMATWSFSRAEINETFLVISKFLTKKKQLDKSGQKLLKNFTKICSKATDDICKSIFNSKNIENDDNFTSNIKFLLYLCSTPNSSDLISTDKLQLLWSSLFPNYPQIDQSDDRSFGDNNLTEIPSISTCLFERASADDLSAYVDYCLTLLKSDVTDNQKILTLYVLKGLVTKKWTKASSKDSRMYKFIDSILDKLLHSITSIVNDIHLSESINLNLFQACGDLTKEIIHVGKELLTSPRIHYCLLICVFSPLRQLVDSPKKYTKALTTYNSILTQFILNYNYMVITSMVMIKELIQEHLTTLIQICDQSKFSNYEKSVQKDLVNCASDFNKLISQLTNEYGKDFALYAPLLISFYINLNHSYSVHPAIKQHLTLCVYRLLNVIKTNPNWQDIYDMIHCRLDESGRDLLKILFENYEKFYVFKGRF